jgi:hypothetical protein
MNLKKQIDGIKIIDDHAHPLDTAYWIDAVGGVPFPPEVHGLELPSATTPLPRVKKLLTIYRDLYGFSHSTLTPQNQQELKELHEQSRSDEASVYHKVLDLAGIESVFEICLSNPELPPGLDPERFKRVPYFDGFLIPLDNSELKKTCKKAELFITMAEIFVKNMQQQLNWYPTSFDEYLKFLAGVMEKLHEQGCIALKMAFGHYRDLTTDVVNKEEARDIFNSKDTSGRRYIRLQDYLLKFILAKAGELGLPVQIHTGATGIEIFTKESDPVCLDKLLWLPELSSAKVVLLHGGYPFCHEAGFMVSDTARRPRQLYLDISLLMEHPSSPNAMVGVLREWLEMGIAPKLIYGSDGTSPIKLWISAMNIRECLHMTLKGMIDDGLIDTTQALSMAEMVLRSNAKKVYNV